LKKRMLAPEIRNSPWAMMTSALGCFAENVPN